MLIAFVAVYASQVKVDLTLRNKNTIRVTVPEGAFQMIDAQKNQALSDTETNDSSSKKTPAESNVRIAQCELETELECEQFWKLWDTAPPALSAEDSAPAQKQTPLTADLFVKCLLTASYLDIQGEYAKRFFKNMVKYGLLEKHSADIVSSDLLSTYNLPQSIFWSLLHAFFEQTGFDYRIVHFNSGQAMLRIENTDACPKKISKEYTGISQTTKIRTVLYSKLDPIGSQKKERNDAVLAWLLLNMGGSSVDIQYSIEATSKDISEVKKTISQFTKENKKGPCVNVEGLTLITNFRNHFSLLLFLQLVPDLSRLELCAPAFDTPNAALYSFVSGITSCKSLRALKITGKLLESAVITNLVDALPILEEVSLWCTCLESTTIYSLKKCTKLQKLEIWGELQPSATVKELVTSLPSLKELIIKCDDLNIESAQSFQACTQLEKLKMWGCNQPKRIVKELATFLPSLKELSIECDDLNIESAQSFQACTQLEKLKMWGCNQPNHVMKELVNSLPSLKELSIECNSLDIESAQSFQKFKKLEKLELIGEETVSFLIKLLEVLPSLQDLKISIDSANLALVDALWECPNLRSLELSLREYSPGFIPLYLQAPLPMLKSLKLYNFDKNNQYREEDKIAVKKAHATKIRITCF
ncbi:hypothetical protein NECID01_1163 [Nematocida sp. AWRm77]|nr:hypothetical protein NECID01_1163 [Nematocida sp. AWRm77]